MISPDFVLPKRDDKIEPACRTGRDSRFASSDKNRKANRDLGAYGLLSF